jgi:predicted DNA-binding transcriptional regulator AlpA
MSLTKRLLPDAKVRERYGVSVQTIWRWDNNPVLQFPSPIRINGRKYRDQAKLDEFDARQVLPAASDVAT